MGVKANSGIKSQELMGMHDVGGRGPAVTACWYLQERRRQSVITPLPITKGISIPSVPDPMGQWTKETVAEYLTCCQGTTMVFRHGLGLLVSG